MYNTCSALHLIAQERSRSIERYNLQKVHLDPHQSNLKLDMLPMIQSNNEGKDILIRSLEQTSPLTSIESSMRKSPVLPEVESYQSISRLCLPPENQPMETGRCSCRPSQ